MRAPGSPPAAHAPAHDLPSIRDGHSHACGQGRRERGERRAVIGPPRRPLALATCAMGRARQHRGPERPGRRPRTVIDEAKQLPRFGSHVGASLPATPSESTTERQGARRKRGHASGRQARPACWAQSSVAPWAPLATSDAQIDMTIVMRDR